MSFFKHRQLNFAWIAIPMYQFKIYKKFNFTLSELKAKCNTCQVFWLNNMWPDLPKGVLYTHSFKIHFSSQFQEITTPMDQQHMCLILLKVDQPAFTQTSFSSLSDVHECSGGLQIAPSSLDKETAGCNSPRDWLMSLAMDLAALCDIWRWKWHQWMPFGCF